MTDNGSRRRCRHTSEQRGQILRDAENLGVVAAARQHGMGESTLFAWRLAARQAMKASQSPMAPERPSNGTGNVPKPGEKPAAPPRYSQRGAELHCSGYFEADDAGLPAVRLGVAPRPLRPVEGRSSTRPAANDDRHLPPRARRYGVLTNNR